MADSARGPFAWLPSGGLSQPVGTGRSYWARGAVVAVAVPEPAKPQRGRLCDVDLIPAVRRGNLYR